MMFSTFSEWLSLRESKNNSKKRSVRASKNAAVDAFINAVEELGKDVKELSKIQKKGNKKNQVKTDDDKGSGSDDEEEKDKESEKEPEEDESDSDDAGDRSKKQID
jgi:Ran GTPase-activating protein (RanGAP) involved in mRNA processing and transport